MEVKFGSKLPNIDWYVRKRGISLNRNAYSTIDLSARRSAQMGVNMAINICRIMAGFIKGRSR